MLCLNLKLRRQCLAGGNCLKSSNRIAGLILKDLSDLVSFYSPRFCQVNGENAAPSPALPSPGASRAATF